MPDETPPPADVTDAEGNRAVLELAKAGTRLLTLMGDVIEIAKPLIAKAVEDAAVKK